MSACDDRASTSRKATSRTTPTLSVVTVVGSPHDVVAAWVRP
jgi:hypothetical protein